MPPWIDIVPTIACGQSDEDSDTLELVPERSYGCLITGRIQSHIGLGFEQPGLVKDVPAHGQGSLKVPYNPNHSTII